MNNFTQLLRFGSHTDDQKSRVIKYIQNLIVVEKGEYEVIVRKYKKSKTTEQLGYYFSTVVPTCSGWQGLTKDDADFFLKEQCGTPRFIDVMGQTYEVKTSIAKMKVDEMAKYIDDCINFLGSHGQSVPPPRWKEMF